MKLAQLSRLVLAAALPVSASFAASSTWRDDVRKVLCTPYFCDVSNRLLPLGSLLGYSTSARFADVDGDHRQDLIVTIMYTANKLIMNRGPDVRMKDETLQRLPMEDLPTEEAVPADLDLDGHVDIVTANTAGDGPRVYINDGTGHFTKRTGLFPKMKSNSVDAVDVDGDGRPDLVFGNEDRPRLFFNRASGFKEADSNCFPRLARFTNDIAVGDLDGDGRPDLFLANHGEHDVLLNDGHGCFRRIDGAVPKTAEDEESWVVALGDVNGDGRLDAFVGDVAFYGEHSRLTSRLLINQGNGIFRDETAKRLPMERIATPAAMFVDIDHDGHLDLVLGSFTDDSWGRRHDAPWRAWLNDGTGRFRDRTRSVFPPGVTGNARYIEATDFNGDGILDLYLASRGGPDLLLLGQRPVRH